MMIYTLINVIVAIIVIIAILYLLFRLFVWRQGNENVKLITKRRSELKLESKDFSSATFVLDIPFGNSGKQYGTIMDLFPRHLLPQEQFDDCKVETWTTHVERGERHDGYFESWIVKPGKGGTARMRLILTGKSGNIDRDIQDIPDFNIDIYYQVVGRTDYRITKQRIRLTHDEIMKAYQG